MALEYQRVQSESNDFVLGKIKLDKVIRESIRKYAKIFIRKKLSMHYEGTDIVVASDEKWLSFIIEQILSNAIKYTKAGSITINVLPNASNKIVCMEIADDGIGISAEDIPRVFEKDIQATTDMKISHQQESDFIFASRQQINSGID